MIPHLLPSVLAALHQGVVVVSPDRRVLFANEVFCGLVHPGLTPEQLVGQSGSDLIDHFKEVFMEPTAFMDRILDIYEKGEPVFGEIIRLRDGRLLSRDHTLIKQDGQIVAYMWVYQEILSRLANEELDIQRVLNRFISTLYEQETEEEILWEVARNCIAYLDFYDCVIYMLDEKKGVLQQRAVWGPKAPAGNEINDYMELPLGVGIVGSVAQSGKAEVIDDVTTDLRYVSDKVSGQSEITVPIFSKGKVIGIIDSEHPQKRFFTNKHLSIMTTLAAVVGIKITQIRERQVRQTEIEKQRLFYEQILNNIPADIAVFNKDHRYLFVNPQGIQNPELRAWIINKNDEEYCDYRGRPYSIFQERRAAFNRAIETQLQAEWEEELINPAGETENHYRKMFPVVNEQGQVDLVIGYGMNITTIKQAQAVLQRAKQEAEANAQAKEAFLARVSHELRTPMNGILGLADLLQRTVLDEKQEQYAQLLRQSAQSLVAIVNEVLDIEKIGSGKMELHPEVFDLRERMQGLLDLCREPAQRKGLLLTLQVEEALPTYFNGDVNRISQILGNILSNALKFTDSGSVQLVVEAHASGICFRVADTGIGIEADSLEKIFEPFVQARSRVQTDRPGTGLGLTICKELSELMGGRIEVESNLGAGSTFRLYLPLQAVMEAASVAAAQSNGPLIERLKGKRILLVEDVPLNRFLVEEMTLEWGIELEMALDGVEGLKKASDSTYDLILMDIQMPVMDGIQCTRSIRQLPDSERAAVPIIALSANAFESDRRNYLQAGMNDALSKPFESTQLLQVLMKSLKPDVVASEAESAAGQQPDTGGIAIDIAYLNRVGNGNPAFIKTMLKSFIESVDEITIEMEQMVAKGDRKSIGEAAHKLKFALGVVGVTALKKGVAFLEDQGKGYSEAAVDQEYTRVASGFIRDLRRLKEEAASKVYRV